MNIASRGATEPGVTTDRIAAVWPTAEEVLVCGKTYVRGADLVRESEVAV